MDLQGHWNLEYESDEPSGNKNLRITFYLIIIQISFWKLHSGFYCTNLHGLLKHALEVAHKALYPLKCQFRVFHPPGDNWCQSNVLKKMHKKQSLYFYIRSWVNLNAISCFPHWSIKVLFLTHWKIYMHKVNFPTEFT